MAVPEARPHFGNAESVLSCCWSPTRVAAAGHSTAGPALALAFRGSTLVWGAGTASQTRCLISIRNLLGSSRDVRSLGSRSQQRGLLERVLLWAVDGRLLAVGHGEEGPGACWGSSLRHCHHHEGSPLTT